MPHPRWDTVPPNQWYQTYYELREGRLYLCENDNKDQHYSEEEIAIDAFLAKHAASTEQPYPEIVALLEAERARAEDGSTR